MNIELKRGHMALILQSFCIVAEIDPKEVRPSSVTFSVYEIEGWSVGETPGAYDDPCINETRYLHGHVKWDGCSNWHFDQQDSCMLHFCERKGITGLAEMMATCWDWAAKIMCAEFRGEAA